MELFERVHNLRLFISWAFGRRSRRRQISVICWNRHQIPVLAMWCTRPTSQSMRTERKRLLRQVPAGTNVFLVEKLNFLFCNCSRKIPSNVCNSKARTNSTGGEIQSPFCLLHPGSGEKCYILWAIYWKIKHIKRIRPSEHTRMPVVYNTHIINGSLLIAAPS